MPCCRPCRGLLLPQGRSGRCLRGGPTNWPMRETPKSRRLVASSFKSGRWPLGTIPARDISPCSLVKKIKLPSGDEFYCLSKGEAHLLYTDLFEERSYF